MKTIFFGDKQVEKIIYKKGYKCKTHAPFFVLEDG